ncbi:E3 ubiquitin-protein ligase rnf8-A-like [Drosophila hydei]|uniref:E3 ubiquitin-protein ligase rnf8-A-like n=1 Tax=Drosophila hydei TaxID=7224 RepID=A0A6J1L7R7_DROHY|nr:E3 ubiquitin-protein ligase rnf8-A-like [Drosophila hydei]
MRPKRLAASGGPPAKQQRGLDTEGKAQRELEALIKERNELKCKLSNATYEADLLKSSSLKLEEAYNSCIKGLQAGMEVLTKMLAIDKSQFALNQLDLINNKLEEVLKQTKELCQQLDEVQKPLLQPDRHCEKEQIASLTKAQTVLVEEFEQKLLQRDQMEAKLQTDLKRQEETYLQQIDELKTQIEQKDATQVDPNYITCSICLETWASSGSHRVVALACGHVFGDMCIRVHLNRSIECPLCRAPADAKELRYLFLEGTHAAQN